MTVMVTQRELKAYLSTLDPVLQTIHIAVDQMVKEMEDTGDENFQVAADLMEVFWNRCRQREESKG